jgi:hypothetical protein
MTRRYDASEQEGSKAVKIGDGNKVLPFRVWQEEFSGLSLGTAKRICAIGEGPPLIRLSPKRRGVRYSDHIAWIESRKIGAAN